MSNPPPPSVPPGWHPDPKKEAQLRYWDGTSWTSHTHNHPQANPQRRSSMTPLVLTAIGLGVVAMIVYGNLNNSDGESGAGSNDPIEQARVVLEANYDEQYTYNYVKTATDNALSATGESLTDRNRAGAWSAVLKVIEDNGLSRSPMDTMLCVPRIAEAASAAGTSSIAAAVTACAFAAG